LGKWGSGVGKCLTPQPRPSPPSPMGKGAFGPPDGHPLRESPPRYGPERGAFGHEMAKKEVPFAGQKQMANAKKTPTPKEADKRLWP
jgi:hypothetical protein